jgi:hypothetical protein
MSRTVDLELVFVGAGIVLVAIALTLHNMNLGMAGLLVAALAAWAAWLDRNV